MLDPERESAARRWGAKRAPEYRLVLKPPLSPCWSRVKPSVPRAPIVGLGFAYFLGQGRRTTAVDVRTGEEVWSATVPGAPTLLHQGLLLVERAGGLLSLLDGRTGDLVRSLDGFRHGGQAVGIGRFIVYGENVGPWCYDCADDRLVWRHARDRRREKAGIFAIDTGTIVNGDPSGTVRGLAVATGEEVWTASVADLAHHVAGLQTTRQGRPHGLFAMHAESTVFVVRDRYVVSLDIANGTRRWVWKAPLPIEEGFLYCDLYHILGLGGMVWVLDPTSGRSAGEYALREGLCHPVKRVSIAPPLLVSEHHYWVGSDEGYLLAFERATGRLTWAYRPDGAQTTAVHGNSIEALDQLLFYSDDSDHVYCLAAVGGD